ncbi:MAG: hypothetical protein EZS28_030112 [Streblomastix strix]|uniref:Uncharacterized protein n=1 Tax=Streblomastix strix TaxID=222440 RepID=A0A5J4UW94_9EUKA|nr:MAG: hypothetical protein EZS28_030112 [Streblomastix strix]
MVKQEEGARSLKIQHDLNVIGAPNPNKTIGVGFQTASNQKWQLLEEMILKIIDQQNKERLQTPLGGVQYINHYIEMKQIANSIQVKELDALDYLICEELMEQIIKPCKDQEILHHNTIFVNPKSSRDEKSTDIKRQSVAQRSAITNITVRKRYASGSHMPTYIRTTYEAHNLSSETQNQNSLVPRRFCFPVYNRVRSPS